MTFPGSGSIWLAEEIPVTTATGLLHDVDVVVVGGGIAGITTAYLLKKAGYKVAVVEARTLFSGTTGRTTAKITTQHGTIYSALDEDTGRSYYQAQQMAFDWLKTAITELNVDCEYQTRNNYIYITKEENKHKLTEEYEAQRRSGLNSEYFVEIDLPFATKGAVRVREQAQFHPVKWLSYLTKEIVGDGSYIAEGIRARSFEKIAGKNRLETSHGKIFCDHLVIASHVPFNDSGRFVAKMTPVSELVVSGEVDNDLSDMYLGIDSSRSIRFTTENDKKMAIVLGYHHKPGNDGNLLGDHKDLARWAQYAVGVGDIAYRWSAMDYRTADRVPYIGRYSHDDENVWVATGFGQWGMTNGTLAGLMISDFIQGIDSPFMETFDPTRLPRTIKSWRSIMDSGVNVVRNRVESWNVPSLSSVSLAPGEARIVESNYENVALYREPATNEVKQVMANCTHQGCLLAFNNDEISWDCPCHGSKFDTDGNVLHGPAINPLERPTE
jgi:glycine/D-amino acid oxidase-like deaminating enzyme/nitrite reductase/ring-hydroxylating ferredoxin subunit